MPSSSTGEEPRNSVMVCAPLSNRVQACDVGRTAASCLLWIIYAPSLSPLKADACNRPTFFHQLVSSTHIMSVTHAPTKSLPPTNNLLLLLRHVFILFPISIWKMYKHTPPEINTVHVRTCVSGGYCSYVLTSMYPTFPPRVPHTNSQTNRRLGMHLPP